MTERLINKTKNKDDCQNNINLKKPKLLDDFIGQHELKNNLKIFIKAAKQRNESLDHVIFYGPAGFGKTTLAGIIAQEMDANFKPTAAPLLNKPCDIAAILTNLQENDVLFIDEIHRLNNAIEEILYPAMSDGHLDIITGKGPAAQTLRISIPQFTLIGATTRIGLLSKPLRDRFGISVQFQPYLREDLEQIIKNTISIFGLNIEERGIAFIANCSRGTPRIAIRIAKRVRDFMQTNNWQKINEQKTIEILKQLGIDSEGLDHYDRKYIEFIAINYQTRPVGIETIAAGLSEKTDNIEETIEPYLIEKNFIQKTQKGRMLTKNGFRYYKQNHPA